MNTWWYISFADSEAWLGGIYVAAPNAKGAVIATGIIGQNPGGEARIFGPITEENMDRNVPAEKRLRLLSKEEI